MRFHIMKMKMNQNQPPEPPVYWKIHLKMRAQCYLICSCHYFRFLLNYSVLGLKTLFFNIQTTSLPAWSIHIFFLSLLECLIRQLQTAMQKTQFLLFSRSQRSQNPKKSQNCASSRQRAPETMQNIKKWWNFGSDKREMT